MIAAACLGCFLATLSAALLAGYRLWVREPAGIPGGGTQRLGENPRFFVPLADWYNAVERLDALLPVPAKARAKVKRMLVTAGYRRASYVPVYFALKALLPLTVPPLLCSFLYAVRPDAFAVGFAGLLAAYGSFRLPSWYVGFVARHRQEEIRYALPDLIDLLVIGVESGLTLDQALRDAGRSLGPLHRELTEELHLYEWETSAGTGRSEALRNLGRRTGEPHTRKLAALLIQTERFGTGVARMLRLQARAMRVRRRQRAEELARQISVKIIFPIFFLIMPSTFLVTAGPAMLYLFVDLKKLLGVE